MSEAIKKTIRRKFEGLVVSCKNSKTIGVEVKTTKLHPKYLKRFIVSKKYQVHDENNEYQKGEKVAFVECRPISRLKRWRALPKNKKV